MKTHLLSMLALLAFLVSSCAQDEMLEKKRLSMSSSKDVEFTASFEEGSINSRTYIEEDSETSKLYLRWTKGDEVSIFRGTTLNQRFKFKGETGDNSGSFGYVPNDDFVSSNELDESRNYAFYPYDEKNKISEKGVLTVTLPVIQKYSENSFGSGSNPMIALTQNTGDVDLKFKNIGGYFKFKLYGDDLTIKSVLLQGNNGEKLAGKAIVTNEYGSTPIVAMSEEATETLTLDCGDGIKVGTTKETATEFWFVLPPTKFTKGFTIVVTDDNDRIFTKTTEKVFEIKRNIVKPISAMDVENTFDNVPFFIGKNEYIVGKDGRTLEVNVLANVDLEVSVSSQCSGWIKFTETRVISENTLSFNIIRNSNTEDRIGSIYIKGGGILQTITVKQIGQTYSGGSVNDMPKHEW